jgi:hypothetical protein
MSFGGVAARQYSRYKVMLPKATASFSDKWMESRSVIALVAWWNISHGAVMAIQTVEASIQGVRRNFADVIVFLVIAVVLLALLPAKREAGAPGVFA